MFSRSCAAATLAREREGAASLVPGMRAAGRLPVRRAACGRTSSNPLPGGSGSTLFLSTISWSTRTDVRASPVPARAKWFGGRRMLEPDLRP